LLQPDGKIVLVGSNETVFGNTGDKLLLIRYNSDGSLDTSFGNGGIVQTSFESIRGTGVAVQPDGKIVAVGNEGLPFLITHIVRYNVNGTLDQTFGEGGKVSKQIGAIGIWEGTKVIVQTDGKIMIGGRPHIFARLNSDGTPDSSFGVNGVVEFWTAPTRLMLYSFLVLPNGKYLLGGLKQNSAPPNDFGLLRLNNDGSVDTTFGENGIVKTRFPNVTSNIEELALRSDGGIIAIGNIDAIYAAQSAVAKYDSNGQLQSKTILRSTAGWGGLVQPDNKVVILGSSRFSRLSDVTNDLAIHRNYDFDRDGKTDFSIYRKDSNGISWKIPFSRYSHVVSKQFGLEEDILTSADYDGDGITDLGIFRPSTGTWWHTIGSLLISNPTHRAFQWGLAGDVPVPADYDGDNKADYAVFRPGDGVWYINNSTDGSNRFVKWGLADDKPVIGDFDGDNKCDVAVWRPSDGVWYVLRSSDNQFTFFQFGLNGDKPVEADYDGDGKTDFAVYRPNEGMWYIWNSANNSFKAVRWGIATDIPTIGDYDGDGKFDYAVYRQSERLWYVLKSSDNTYFTHQSGDDSYLPIQGN